MAVKTEKDRDHTSTADEFEKDVQRRCHAQIPVDELAAKFECSVESLEQRFGNRMEQWRKQGRAMARQELFWAACSGKISALMFFLKSYCGLGSAARPEPEDPVRTYKVELRRMSDAELQDEIERQRGARGARRREEIASGNGGGETSPNSELA